MLSTLPFAKWIRETTLGANEWKNESTRLKWSNDLEDEEDCPNDGDCSGDDIVLKPMEIKSFIVGF